MSSLLGAQIWRMYVNGLSTSFERKTWTFLSRLSVMEMHAAGVVVEARAPDW
jgi:hypothetical protein